jgi:hypothetical protein
MELVKIEMSEEKANRYVIFCLFWAKELLAMKDAAERKHTTHELSMREES